MSEYVDEIASINDLRNYVHKTLCEKEQLLAEQFHLSEMLLTRRERSCGIQFSIHGPRNVRLGAIWASDHNMLYFYDAHGARFSKVRLKRRLLLDSQTSDVV